MRHRIFLFFIAGLFVPALLFAQMKFDRGIQTGVFIPKGTWMAGTTFSYSEHEDDNFKFFILDDVKSLGYTFKISPFFGYFFRDNIAVGGRFTYNRSYTDLGNLSLSLDEDLSFEIKDALYLEHTFSGSLFLRTYMPIGNSKIFGLFNEARCTYGYGQGKNSTGTGNELSGTYQTINNLQIGFSPGLSAFVTNYAALEVSVGVLGFNAKWIDQITDQVHESSRRTSSAKFKIDLFSINIGMNLYF